MVLLSMRRSLCVGEDNFKRKENHSLDKRKESSILLATDGEELLAFGGPSFSIQSHKAALARYNHIEGCYVYR